MNKVVTIHLDGIAYSLEEAAYDVLKAYLAAAEHKLAQNPDKDEILKDFEQAIGAKLSGFLTAHKNVLTQSDVDQVIAEMGPVAAEGEVADAESSGQKSEGFPPNKKLYRISEGRWIAGVCNGLAVYFNIDVTLVRILFVLLTVFSHGLGGLIYILMMIFVPVARTPKEYEHASGIPPVTAQELVDRARKSVEDFAKSGEWQNWSESFKSDWNKNRYAWKTQHKAWKHAERNRVKAERMRMKYEHRHSVVSEIFGIACATLAITFVLWFLYGHVALVHDFFNALHGAYQSFINSLAQLLDSNNR